MREARNKGALHGEMLWHPGCYAMDVGAGSALLQLRGAAWKWGICIVPVSALLILSRWTGVQPLLCVS